MNLYVIGTGSKGNCYLLCENNHYIVLDCGLKFQEITSYTNFPSFCQIDFVWCSHQHGDHSKSLKNFKMSGCNCLTYEKLKPELQKWNMGYWDCLTFPVSHNVPNWGIVIKSKQTNEKFCYVTDFCALPKIEGIDYWLFEVNYIEKYIDTMIDDGIDIQNLGFNNHFSLEQAVDYFNSLQTRPKGITCCHLSQNNSIEDEILKEMSDFADKVQIAHNWRKYGNRLKIGN